MIYEDEQKLWCPMCGEEFEGMVTHDYGKNKNGEHPVEAHCPNCDETQDVMLRKE